MAQTIWRKPTARPQTGAVEETPDSGRPLAPPAGQVPAAVEAVAPPAPRSRVAVRADRALPFRFGSASDLDDLAPADLGERQMAADEDRLEAAASGEAEACFRIYRWLRPTVTLGRAQPESSIDRALADSLGIDVVRRPTGGRALLHGNDLTYSVVVPPGHPLARLGVVESYRRISASLVEAFHDAGLEAGMSPGAEVVPLGPGVRLACFEEHLVETLTLGGRKVCGSAQARRRGAVLQHGSIPLSVDHRLEARILCRDEDPEVAARRLEARFAGVEDPGGRPGSALRLARALHRRLAQLVCEGA